jgi:hypothetical protein
MAGIDHAPPPFFKRGPAPLALLTFYIAISSALFVVDLRFQQPGFCGRASPCSSILCNGLRKRRAAWSTTRQLSAGHASCKREQRTQARQAQYGAQPAATGPAGSRKRAAAQIALGQGARESQGPGRPDSLHGARPLFAQGHRRQGPAIRASSPGSRRSTKPALSARSPVFSLSPPKSR